MAAHRSSTVPRQLCATYVGLEGILVDRPVEQNGAAIPDRRRPATRVVTLQWPCGAPARSRLPRDARPR
jgi:hypothetical protein